MPATPPSDAPYCRECGYSFVGLTDTARCPECGRPIVDVLTRDSLGYRPRSVRWQSERQLFGRPLVAIAKGPAAGERLGHARGIIAIGDMATGVVAIGAIARGVFALGAVAVGCVSFGGVSVGVIAFGGTAIGVVAVGALAIGFVTLGSASLYLYRGFGVARVRIGHFF